MVDPLLKNGADVDMRNRDGMTALHVTAGMGNRILGVFETVINLLLKSGADASIHSDSGVTVREYAVVTSSHRVIGLLGEAASEEGR